MISYDPHDWRSHLFDVKGSVIREIAGRVLACGLWAAIVVWVFRMVESERGGGAMWLHPTHWTFDPTIHSMIGFAVGLLLVFRTNSSYDRFWEGRRLWGGIVNESRNLARSVCVHVKTSPSLRNDVVRSCIAFAYASMHHLRGAKSIGPMAERLPPSEVSTLLAARHVPLEIATRTTLLLRRAMEQGLWSDYLFTQADHNVQLLIDYLGGCERIHKTPLPYAYMVHLRRVIILYLATLPFGIYKQFGWATVGASLFVAFIFFGIEEIGVEIEDPFEGADNDIPLEAICDTIDRDLSSLIGEEPAPLLPQFPEQP